MDDTYLIEIRLAMTRWRIKESNSAIGLRYDIGDLIERHPHVTLFGPLAVNPGITEEQLLAEIGRVASGYDPVPFMIGPWEKREGMHGSVIAFSVRPSDELKLLTRAIAEAIAPLVRSLNVWDAEPEWKWFHVTVANKLERRRADTIFSRITSEKPIRDGYVRYLRGLARKIRGWFLTGRDPVICPVLIDDAGLRVTIMRGEEILAEYDLPGRRWVTGPEIHDKSSWQKTLAEFRKRAGFELTGSAPSGSGGTFFIADLHLGHANIIRYCSRPFLYPDSGEMDRVIIGNWNRTITPDDRVYFAGDLRYGSDAAPAGEYARQLAGSTTFIRGNHDTDLPGSVDSAIIEDGDLRFFIVHDPADAPPDFSGWIIHGHHHNNNLGEYPFINFEHRRVNVSAEVVGYVPVSLREIAERIHEGVLNGVTAPVLLRYPYVR